MTAPNFGPERLADMSDANRIVLLEEQVKWLNWQVDGLTDRLAASEQHNFLTRMSVVVILGVAFILGTITLL